MLLVDASSHNHGSPPDGPGVSLMPERLSRAKAAYTTRRVDLGKATRLLTDDHEPKAGDVVLARIERIGQHKRIELASGRRARLHVGDEVVVCYGARYAPDQFEAYVPGDLGPCHLVAAGGVAGVCKVKHERMNQPTALLPLGLLTDAHGRSLNLNDWSLPEAGTPYRQPVIIAVFGTMMNSGKTTTAGHLIKGFKRKGMCVGAAKVTGTGAGGDRWFYVDAGADIVFDFTDMGEPSTFGLSAERVEKIFVELTDHLAVRGVDVIVLEVADGLYQRETAALLRSDKFRTRCGGVLFAAGDALGAVSGVQHLEKLGHTVLAASGTMTASPLAVQEARQVLDVPVLTVKDLSTARWLPFADTLSVTGDADIWELSKKSPDLAQGESESRYIKPMNGGQPARLSA